MKKINKTLYAFITFVLMWIIISLPNNSIFIENWDFRCILCLYGSYTIIIAAMYVIMPDNFNSLFKLLLPLIIISIIMYLLISICSLHFNCLTWDKSIKIFFAFITLFINFVTTLILLFYKYYG